MSAISKPLPKRRKTASPAILAIDFDGVIHDVATHQPLPGALDTLDILANRGFKIIVFSVRATTGQGHQWIEDWLDNNGIRYNTITGSKPTADLYIDDKAVYHQNWDNTLEQISQRLNLPINII